MGAVGVELDSETLREIDDVLDGDLERKQVRKAMEDLAELNQKVRSQRSLENVDIYELVKREQAP